MRKLLKMALALGLIAVLSGCHQYRIMKFADHDNAETKLNQLEVMKVSNFFVYAMAEHQFWLCTDKGDELECTRTCGGERDVKCPMATGGGSVLSTNTR